MGLQPRTEVRGHECIFVVEDEDTVRLCVCHILKSHGYQVIVASNGVEALKIWSEHAQKIDLLLTDMVMPEGITGLELARRLLQDRPALKIIYTSGYSREIAKSQSPFPAGHLFIAKPYQSNVLLHTIRSCLDRPESTVKD